MISSSANHIGPLVNILYLDYPKGGSKLNKKTEWAKVIVVLVIVITVTILGFFEKIQSQAVVGLLSAAMGYAWVCHGVLQAVMFRKKADLDTRMP